MLNWWMPHHAALFDHGVVIDYASTDRSLNIVKEHAPHWEIRQSRNEMFDAVACDAEVMDIERSIDGWKMALTATEFLYCKNLPEWLETISGDAARVQPVAVVDMQECTVDRALPLPYQCRTGFVGGYMEPFKRRIIHRHPDGQYHPGRHGSDLPNFDVYPPGALLLWYGFAPWTPELRSRKLQIQNRIPSTDAQKGFGAQHMISEEQLRAKWQELVAISGDLSQIPEYRSVIL